MDVIIKFSESAFRHGVTEDDIRCAFKTIKYDAILEEVGCIDKHLLIGFDRSANPIEILYNDLDEDTVLVFHAWYFWVSPKIHEMPKCIQSIVRLGENYTRYDRRIICRIRRIVDKDHSKSRSQRHRLHKPPKCPFIWS
jgi:hypothetical protein